MNASQYAGTVIVPTLSRIVLCAAFFTAGWAKVFTNTTYTPSEVQTLQKLDIDVRQTVAMHRDAAPGIIAVNMPLELLTQDEPDQPATGGETPAGETETAAEPVKPIVGPEIAPSKTQIPDDEQDEAATTPPPVTGSAEAAALYKVAITLDNAGWQYAKWLAWGAALVQLIGGALLLIGLFSRLWGLALAVTMALAFHIMSMDMFIDAPFAIAQKLDGGKDFNQVYAQLALFVLAFGIFITGPGPLSLDRAIFRRSAPDDIEIDMHEPT